MITSILKKKKKKSWGLGWFSWEIVHEFNYIQYRALTKLEKKGPEVARFNSFIALYSMKSSFTEQEKERETGCGGTLKETESCLALLCSEANRNIACDRIQIVFQSSCLWATELSALENFWLLLFMQGATLSISPQPWGSSFRMRRLANLWTWVG